MAQPTIINPDNPTRDRYTLTEAWQFSNGNTVCNKSQATGILVRNLKTDSGEGPGYYPKRLIENWNVL